MHPMRRKDRQITDLAAIRALLQSEDVLHLALCADGKPYVVPMSYGFTLRNDGKLTLHLHCAREGRKLDILRKNPAVGFEISRKVRLAYDEATGSCTAKYRSLIGSGTVVMEEEAADKLTSLHALMRQAGHENYPPFDEALLARTLTLRIEAEEYAAKSNLSPDEEENA